MPTVIPELVWPVQICSHIAVIFQQCTVTQPATGVRLTVKLAEMSKRYPLTGRAYRIVAGLDDFYASRNPKEAESAFDGLYSWMRRCRLKPMKVAAETLKRHKDKILAYFKNRLTNAICEGINAMIQAAKRKARGFHTFEGYSSMIYLVAGKLDLAVPNPF